MVADRLTTVPPPAPIQVGNDDFPVAGVETILVAGANKAQPCDSANKVGTAMIDHLKGSA